MFLRVNTVYRSDAVLRPSAATQELAKHGEQLLLQELGRLTRSKLWRTGQVLRDGSVIELETPPQTSRQSFIATEDSERAQFASNAIDPESGQRGPNRKPGHWYTAGGVMATVETEAKTENR